MDTDFCAMCGHDRCSVRISKEIVEFYSGKDEAAQPEKPAAISPGVSPEGIDTLKKRGNLSQEEIFRLAHKGKKAACHSDNVNDEAEAKLVQIGQSEGVEEELRKAAWRGLRRSKRARVKAEAAAEAAT